MRLDPDVWGNVFPELVPPDETQRRPILGFRLNRVHVVRKLWGKPSVVLRSLGSSGYSWGAGRNEAVCWPSGPVVRRQPRHQAPASGCSCGLYAVHDLNELSTLTLLAQGDVVLAGVAGAGIVRVHTRGWRAQFARIVALSIELPQIPMEWTLTNRERHVLLLLSGSVGGHRLSFEDVGKRFGVSAERIRQIEAKAVEKTRHQTVGAESEGNLSRRVRKALEAKYQVPVVPMGKLKEMMADAGNFWEETR